MPDPVQPARLHRLKAFVHGPYRAKARALRDRLQFLLMFVRFVVAGAVGRVNEIWIGDSHVAHFNDPTWPCRPLRQTAPGRWVFWLGPKLMHTLAIKDMPPDVRRMATVMRFIGRPNRIVWVFATGEIDIRCHLVPRLRDTTAIPTFPARYLSNVLGTAKWARAACAAVVVPVPPSATYAADPGQFPVLGTLSERVAVHRRIRAALIDAAAIQLSDDSTVPLVLIDATDELSESTGAIRPDVTVDGCHTNEAGRQIVRAKLDEALLESKGWALRG